MFCCFSFLSRGKPCVQFITGLRVLAQAGRVEDECLELCSCTLHFEDALWVFVKCAILLSFKERKWDFLPQSPAEPLVLLKYLVIQLSSYTSLAPRCLSSEWDSPLADKRGENQRHRGRLFQSLLQLPRLGKTGSSPCSSTALSMAHHDLHLHSLHGAPTWNCSFQSSGPSLLGTVVVIRQWKKPGLSLFLCCLKCCAF